MKMRRPRAIVNVRCCLRAITSDERLRLSSRRQSDRHGRRTWPQLPEDNDEREGCPASSNAKGR